MSQHRLFTIPRGEKRESSPLLSSPSSLGGSTGVTLEGSRENRLLLKGGSSSTIYYLREQQMGNVPVISENKDGRSI